MKKEFPIRPIQEKDNAQMTALIREIFEEMDIPKEGTAYADGSLNNLFETYQGPKSIYFVVTKGGVIVGGAGISPLENYQGNVCELQKMYLSNATRGKGLGTQMIEKCLQKAKEFGFEGCYLETMPYMKAAQSLYLNNGFKYIDSPMGCTGHTACPVYMYKEL